MDLIINPGGNVGCIYDEMIDLATLGDLSIKRASYVEPDEQGRWWVDLRLSCGPRIGPFVNRSGALEAERSWVQAR